MESDRFKLTDDDVLMLTGESFDVGQLVAALAPLNLEPKITQRFFVALDEIKRLVLEHGVSYVWRLARLQESAVPPNPANRPTLLQVLSMALSNLAPTKSLTIVDAYLLEGSPQSASNDLIAVIGPILGSIADLTLVTRSLKPATVSYLTSAVQLQAPACKITHYVSDRYHDRFWIVDHDRGLFVGTSLGGVGKKYFLFDYLEPNDVSDVVSDLRAEGLL